MNMPGDAHTAIRRIGSSPRWSDVVIHRGVARWVEVAEDPAQDVRGQIRQVLDQIDGTLAQIGSGREWLLEITVHLADLSDVPVLNELWDAWVPPGQAPVRACVQSGLSGSLRVELIVHAAIRD